MGVGVGVGVSRQWLGRKLVVQPVRHACRGSATRDRSDHGIHNHHKPRWRGAHRVLLPRDSGGQLHTRTQQTEQQTRVSNNSCSKQWNSQQLTGACKDI